MKAGNFNINDYLERLFENAEGIENKEGLIIPDENKKSYDWLKKEYHAGQTEVKVEMKFQGAKFEPGYDLQTDLDSVKDFKPGMYGEVKTGDNEKPKSLDSKKEVPNFSKEEGEKKEDEKEKDQKDQKDKTQSTESNITDKKETNEEKPKVKKVDLKAKKTNESFSFLNEISDEQLQKQIEKAKAEGRKISPEYEKQLWVKQAENKGKEEERKTKTTQKDLRKKNEELSSIIQKLNAQLEEKPFVIKDLKNAYFIVQKEGDGSHSNAPIGVKIYLVTKEEPKNVKAYIEHNFKNDSIKGSVNNMAIFANQYPLLASIIKAVNPESKYADRKEWSSL